MDEIITCAAQHLINLCTADEKETDKAILLGLINDIRVQRKTVKQMWLYHYDLGHSPFTKLQQRAKDGTFPLRLTKCKVPVCSACQYARATKRLRRSRNIRDREAERLNNIPGAVVSVVRRPNGITDNRPGSR